METENISIPKKHLIFLVPTYRKRAMEIKSIIADLQDELNSIDFILDKFKLTPDDEVAGNVKQTSVVKKKEENIDENSTYNKSWVWIDKIIYAMKFFNRPMTTGEITRYLYEHEPHLKGKGRSISAVISLDVTKENGRLYKIDKETGRDLYFIKELKESVKNNAAHQGSLLDN